MKIQFLADDGTRVLQTASLRGPVLGAFAHSLEHESESGAEWEGLTDAQSRGLMDLFEALARAAREQWSAEADAEFLEREKTAEQAVLAALERDPALNLRGPGGQTALHIRAKNREWEACAGLMERGADPNLADDLKRTPAAEAVRAGNSDALERFAEGGLDLHAPQDHHGHTLMHLAVIAGGARALAVIDRLVALEIEAGGAGNDLLTRPNHAGETPLHTFALTRYDSLEEARALANALIHQGTGAHRAWRRGAAPAQAAPGARGAPPEGAETPVELALRAENPNSAAALLSAMSGEELRRILGPAPAGPAGHSPVAGRALEFAVEHERPEIARKILESFPGEGAISTRTREEIRKKAVRQFNREENPSARDRIDQIVRLIDQAEIRASAKPPASETPEASQTPAP